MKMIAHAIKVESYFGYWPEFSDGKIVSFSYEAPSKIILGILYIDAEKEKAAEVHLRFNGVADVELSELKSENVIDALRIIEGQPVSVVLESCYGLVGRFTCKAVEVASLLPYSSLQARRP